MWKVTYAIDSLDSQPDVIKFDEQWEALEFASDEMQRRVEALEHAMEVLEQEDAA